MILNSEQFAIENLGRMVITSNSILGRVVGYSNTSIWVIIEILTERGGWSHECISKDDRILCDLNSNGRLFYSCVSELSLAGGQGEITIVPPEGYEIDIKKSSPSNICFKRTKENPKFIVTPKNHREANVVLNLLSKVLVGDRISMHICEHSGLTTRPEVYQRGIILRNMDAEVLKLGGRDSMLILTECNEDHDEEEITR